MKIKNKLLLSIGICCTIFSIILFVAIYYIDVEKIDKLLNGIASIMGVSGAISLSLSLSLNVNVDSNDNNIDLNKSDNNQIYNSRNNLYVMNQQPSNELVHALDLVAKTLNDLKNDNLNNIIDKVKHEIQNGEVDDNLTIDKDFLLRYIEDGSSISDSDVQEIWAKLLASNLKNSNSISKTTLSVVKDLRKEDALLFEDILDYSCEDGMVYKCLTKKNFNFMQISSLKDSGLFKSDSMITKTLTITANSKSVIKNSNLIILIMNQNNYEVKVSLETDVLTREGLELKKSLNRNISDSNIIKLGKWIKDNNKNVSVTVNRIISFNSDESISYDTNDLL